MVEQIQEEFMRKAIRPSVEKMRAGYDGHFGAVIVRHVVLIARGYHRGDADNDPTAHAEADVIQQACAAWQTNQLPDCDLYNSCEPCPMCLGAIYWARLRHVYYGNTQQDAAAIGFDDHFIYQKLTKIPTKRTRPMTPLRPEEAIIGFRAWTEHLNKTGY